MLNIRLSDRLTSGASAVLALPVRGSSDPGGDGPELPASDLPIDDDLRAEVEAFLGDSGHTGRHGAIAVLPRPLRTPRRVLLVGIGAGDPAGWRAAGAGLARAAGDDSALSVVLPPDATYEMVRAFAEGLWLASYTFRLTQRRPVAGSDTYPPVTLARHGARAEVFVDTAPDETLRQITLCTRDVDGSLDAALTHAHSVATATRFARDLTNMPSEDKTPGWFADQVVRVAAGNERLHVHVRAGEALVTEGFGGIVAVGAGSARGPRLVELSWHPDGARTHVVLVGKGITFDTGGICVKPREAMKLMRKDMGGAAAIIAATFAAAEMNLPVRITALAPLAENMISGSAFRPGDVVRHYGGATSEILNTDAEGRVVLADVLAYAAEQFEPDYLIDLATLTGANAVALGKRTGALYSDNDALAGALFDAALAAGEKVWRMPLHDDYLRDIRSDMADIANASTTGAGSVMAALYLREFTGDSRSRWAHIDMSAPSWADGPDGELSKGATGWGVRTLLRWLETLD